MTPEHEALLNWPNNDSIRNRIMALIVLQRGNPNPGYKYPNVQATWDAAPDLEHLISSQMDEYDMPEKLLEYLDLEQTRVATEILEHLPHNQKDRLHLQLTQNKG